MHTKVFQQLQQLLQEATDFADIQEFFFDHIGEAPELTDVSTPVKAPLVEQALQAALNSMLVGPVKIRQLLLLAVLPHQFLHGGFFANGRVGTVFYFENIHMGLACISQRSGQTLMARFSTCPLPPPSRN